MGQDQPEASVKEDFVDEDRGVVMPGISERRLDVAESRKRIRAYSLNSKIKLKVENEERFKEFIKNSGDRSPIARMQTVTKGRVRTKGTTNSSFSLLKNIL